MRAPAPEPRTIPVASTTTKRTIRPHDRLSGGGLSKEKLAGEILPNDEAQKMGDLAIDFCGEWYEPSDEDVFNLGREGDPEVDDNP